MNTKLVLAFSITLFLSLALGAAIISYPWNESDTSSETAVKQFSEQTQDKIIAEIGQPIEGFEPFMFLRVYPGLQESDFQGVDAAIGVYTYREGALLHDLQNQQAIHSAAGAITEQGMQTLLSNIASRLNISLEHESAVDSVIAAIETAGEVTISGQITCLPHKETDGPITLECAIGLKSKDGQHYGLRNLDAVAPITSLATGTQVEIEGTLLPPPPTTKYGIVGVITVQSLHER